MNESGQMGAHLTGLAVYTAAALLAIAVGWVFLVDTWTPR